LTVLGFSTGTAAAAKGITAGYVQTGKLAKTGLPANPTPATTGGIFQDGSGGPELAKIQMIPIPIIGIGIFLATVFHEIAIGDIRNGLPATADGLVRVCVDGLRCSAALRLRKLRRRAPASTRAKASLPGGRRLSQ
jgi:hypothetical protein